MLRAALIGYPRGQTTLLSTDDQRERARPAATEAESRWDRESPDAVRPPTALSTEEARSGDRRIYDIGPTGSAQSLVDVTAYRNADALSCRARVPDPSVPALTND